MKTIRFLTTGLIMLSLVGVGACRDRNATPLPDTQPQTTTPEVTPDNSNAGDAGTTSQNQPNGATTTNPNASDLTIIPGERVGSVTAATSREDLAAIYGEDALQDQPIPMGEGTTEPGTVVDLGPDQQFSVVWKDAAQTEPLLVKDFGKNWKTQEGIGVGTSYASLKSILGNFQLYGFAWDYEGSLVLEGSKLDKYYGDLLLRVRPSEEAIKAHPDAYQAVMGDTLYPSNDPNLEPLELSVYDMTIYLNPLVEE